MVHKSNIIPGLSAFIDSAVLSQYPPTSLKRIAAAGALALYLKQNSNIVEILLSNPLVNSLNLQTDDGLVDLDTLRDVYKSEIAKAGYLRINFPILGPVDFTPEDVDKLYQHITSISNPSTHVHNSVGTAPGGIY